MLGTIDSIVDSGFAISARKLASFTGQILSASPVSGNISRIMTTRHCVLSTLSVQHWEEKIELHQYCIEKLRFWRTNLNTLKVRDVFLIHKPQRPPVSLVARALHYLSLQKARATIVVPVWPSSSFWPLLVGKYKQFMKGCFLFPVFFRKKYVGIRSWIL